VPSSIQGPGDPERRCGSFEAQDSASRRARHEARQQAYSNFLANTRELQLATIHAEPSPGAPA